MGGGGGGSGQVGQKPFYFIFGDILLSPHVGLDVLVWT